MAPVKNNKGKAPVTDGPAARTRSVTRNQAPETLPAATQALRRSRAPRRDTNPDTPASSASVQRPQARSETAQITRPTSRSGSFLFNSFASIDG
ncbi:uncharacterized protein LDX57_012193 [Aspergillus melleus]|uniref:uncharacterized protein n=1 Tax=Aspergillus melleus TaxID=138277 RepID=UPI001E8D870A|nr:uncharacterized protein LDX57_012193 [Aspergillus melleus]KAH8434550.1 hypothetical protein LDX57_012193 [Aspergillus melleus]